MTTSRKSRKINETPATWEITIPSSVTAQGTETVKVSATKCFVEGGALYFQDAAGEVAGFNTWNNYQRIAIEKSLESPVDQTTSPPPGAPEATASVEAQPVA